MRRIANLFFLLLIIAVTVSAQKKEYTVEAVQKLKETTARGLREVQWFEKGTKYSYVKFDTVTSAPAIFATDVVTGEEKVFLSVKELKTSEEASQFRIQSYLWSPDERYILFTGALIARSLKTGGAFYIYDLSNHKFFLLAGSGEQMNARFSPDGNKLAFVRDHNLFVVDISSQKEKQLTFDGNKDIFNGHSDWVYEEEFSLINGIEWSTDSKLVAYFHFDQSPVPELQIAKWDSLHFNFLQYHYPKPGDKNSIVKIGIADIESGKTTWADLGTETDIYVPRIKFTQNLNTLSVQRFNRLQNKVDLLFVDAQTGSSKIVLTDKDSCWVEVYDMPVFLKDGKRFIWTSSMDGFEHFYLYDISGKLINQITKGSWEVDKFLGVNEEAGTVYFTSSERSPINRDFYTISLNGKNKRLLTPEAGTHDIVLSSNFNYYFDKYSNGNTLPATSLYSSNGEKVRELIKADMRAFNDYGYQPVEFLKFKTSDGIELNASIIKPAGFDPSKKYPVLIHNYSGPGSQSVLDRWNGELWHQLLAQKGYIIFTLDNRGTGARGKAFRNLIYKNLGTWEPNDQIEGAKYLASLKYVDAGRIGIWGWSYGGYNSALTLMKGANYFKAAIAVAPVTNWRFYDNIYTERYMSLPELNKSGYDNSSIMKYVKEMKGKLLLVHGTADDNVHFQNSVALVTKLIEETKQFETMYYPEKEHSIYGGKTRLHLYTMFTNFILNNL